MILHTTILVHLIFLDRFYYSNGLKSQVMTKEGNWREVAAPSLSEKEYPHSTALPTYLSWKYVFVNPRISKPHCDNLLHLWLYPDWGDREEAETESPTKWQVKSTEMKAKGWTLEILRFCIWHLKDLIGVQSDLGF